MTKDCTVSKHPVIAEALTRMRDVNSDSATFRREAARLAGVLFAEATADITASEEVRETPLAPFVGSKITGPIAIVPILRAGLGMVEAALALLPDASVLHVGLARNEVTLEPETYYDKLPEAAEHRLAFVLDPMLATGGSAIAAIDMVKAAGIPDVRFVGIVGSPEGVGALKSAHPSVTIHLAALDECLNDVGYILPGLGDAGDRIFATN
jgi:uracil phosphoribosyltransferase